MKSFSKISKGSEYFHWDVRNSKHTESTFLSLSLWKKSKTHKFSEFLLRHHSPHNQGKDAKHAEHVTSIPVQNCP